MIEDKVRELIQGTIQDMGIILDQVIYEKEGSNYFLRIIIDRDVPVDVDTCVKVSQAIDPLLDKCDIIEDSYILDVSSKERGELKDE